MKIAIGTVQFGVPYGISNVHGQTTEQQAADILDFAYQNKVRCLDTAALYGNSEERLGRILTEDKWCVVTKTPHFQGNVITDDHVEELNTSFERSLNNLNRDSIDGLLLHSCDDFFKPGGIKLFKEMEKIRDSGVIRKIGVSVYGSKQIDRLLHDFDVDLIQLPINVLDQRLIESGLLAKLKKRGVEIHVRSIFLQGLLLMDSIFRPSKFDQWKEVWDVWGKWLYDNEITSIEACLNFVEAEKMIDHIVIGVDSLSQLKEILNIKNKNDFVIPEELKITDQNLLIHQIGINCENSCDCSSTNGVNPPT